MSQKCSFVAFVRPTEEILHQEWLPMECGRFFSGSDDYQQEEHT